MVSNNIQANYTHTRGHAKSYLLMGGSYQKAAGPGSDSSRPCVCVSVQLPWHVEPSILHEVGHEVFRYAHCNDPLDTAANLRRKSSKDLLLCVIKR